MNGSLVGRAVGCLLSVFGVIGAAAAQAPMVMKFSHVVAADTPKGRAADKFAELAARYTDGRVKIDVYPNSQLFEDREELAALNLGAVQFLAPSLSKFAPLGVREFEVFDLPYIIPDRRVLRAVLDGPIGRELLDRLDGKSITGLAYWDNGFKVLSANRPLHLPRDANGLKLRIQASRVLDAQMKAVGALPVPMVFSEVFNALQNRVIDGTENPPSNMFSQKMHTVQAHTTLSYHGYIGYAVIANKKHWDALPEDLRAPLRRALAEATAFANAIAADANDQALDAIRSAGTTQIHTPDAAQARAWRQAPMPVHAAMGERLGPELIEKFYAVARANGYPNFPN